jgi:heptosyltransferase-2
VSPRPIPSIPREEVRRLLIHGTNWIGDVVLISPAVRALRETYPEARISYLARGALADAVRGDTRLDEVIHYDRAGRHRPPFGTLRLARALRARRFDLAVLFPKSFEAALISRLAGIPRRAGWRTDGRGPLITHGRRMEEEDRTRHHVWQFFEPARFAGASPPAPDAVRVEFPVSDDDRGEARRLLAEEGLDDGRFLLAVHAAASKEPRAWHAERFAEAAERIVGPRGGAAVLLGGPGDGVVCSRIRKACSAPCVELWGRTSIPGMAAVIERSGLFLGNDSGPMHLAAAVGTPSVAIFGPGAPDRTAPVAGAGRCRVVTRSFSCAPCRQDFFRECEPARSGKPACLEEIAVDDVVLAAEELLATAGP